jgi:hypothetical protein
VDSLYDITYRRGVIPGASCYHIRSSYSKKKTEVKGTNPLFFYHKGLAELTLLTHIQTGAVTLRESGRASNLYCTLMSINAYKIKAKIFKFAGNLI